MKYQIQYYKNGQWITYLDSFNDPVYFYSLNGAAEVIDDFKRLSRTAEDWVFPVKDDHWRVQSV